MKDFLKNCLNRMAAALLVLAAINAPIIANEPGLQNFKETQTYEANQFFDVPSFHWAYDNVKSVYQMNLMNGVSENHFAPSGTLTGVQALTIACRLHSIYYNNHIPNTETKAGEPWFAPYLQYAREHNLSLGVQPDLYQPVTRLGFALILGSAFPDKALNPINMIEDGAIPDVSGPYAEDVYLLYRAGILTGSDAKGSFQPDASITRGSAAAIVSRMARPELRKSVELVKQPENIVPIDQLQNLKSLKKKCTDEEFQKAYDEALKIITPLADKTPEEQLRGIAKDLRSRFVNGGEYSMDKSHYNDPYGYLILNTASCAGCTRATGLCLSMLGLDWEHVNENQYSHQWTRVNLDGTYWICDAFGLYTGPEPAPYSHPHF